MLPGSRVRRPRAFTLLELIVVIVVLGVLVALVAFAYQSFISDSRQQAVRSTADQIGKSVASQSAKEQISSADAVAAAPWTDDLAGTGVTVAPGTAAADGSLPVVVTQDGFCVAVTFTTATGHAGDIGDTAPAGGC